MAGASATRGQRSHNRLVSKRKTSSRAISGNIVAPVPSGLAPLMTKGRRRPPLSKALPDLSDCRRRDFLAFYLGLAPRPSAGLTPRRGLFGAPPIPPVEAPLPLQN